VGREVQGVLDSGRKFFRLRGEHEWAHRHAPDSGLDHGIAEVRAAGLLAVMGIFDLAGTTFSGWFTTASTAVSPFLVLRPVRNIALVFAVFIDASGQRLVSFCRVLRVGLGGHGSPTVRLTGRHVWQRKRGRVYGWIGAAHQLGASLAPLGQFVRTYLGDYRTPFGFRGAVPDGCYVASLHASGNEGWRLNYRRMG